MAIIKEDFYSAELTEWDGRECTACWLVYVSKDRVSAFTSKAANQIIDFANQKYKEVFGKDVSFQKLRLDMTDYTVDTEYVLDDGITHPRSYSKKKTGTYDKRTNCLRIWVDGLPVYENNNGKICKDSGALADCLM